MPRPKKNVSPEERLDQVTKELEETKELLGKLKDEKRMLEEQIRQKQLGALYDLIQESGKSLEEVRAILVS